MGSLLRCNLCDDYFWDGEKHNCTVFEIGTKDMWDDEESGRYDSDCLEIVRGKSAIFAVLAWIQDYDGQGDYPFIQNHFDEVSIRGTDGIKRTFKTKGDMEPVYTVEEIR